jgi:plastocyanin
MQITLQSSVCASNFRPRLAGARAGAGLRGAWFVAITLWAMGLEAFGVDLRILVKDQTGRPVEGALVWAQQPGGKNAGAPLQWEIVQRNRQFLPMVTVIPVGSTVRFPNQDNVQHHVYSFSLARTFDIPLYLGQSPPIQFDRPGIITLGCNIHDWMLAYIVVLDTALYAQTDAKGLASLRDLPADAMIHAWCPRMRGDPIAHRLQPGQSYVELVLKLRPAFSRTPPDDREGGYR